MRRLAATALLAVAAALGGTSAASAAIWTPVPSGLAATDTIRAIEYQGPNRLWLATSSGKVATRQGDGSFAVTSVVGSVNGFNDIAFKPEGATGIAVGNNGYIERTTNGGATWTRVSFTELQANDRADPYDCGGFNNGTNTPLNSTVNPLVTLYSVHWGPGSTVLVTGREGTVLRSTNDGASFTEINRYQRAYSSTDSSPTIGCRIGAGSSPDIFDAQFASTGDPNQIYFMGDFGPIYYTDSGLSSGSTPVQTSDIGCSGEFGRFALDPANPANQWAATDRGTDGPCLYYTTTTSANNYSSPDIINGEGTTQHASTDIARAGGSPGTVVTVGKGGNILNSVDGRNFYVNGVSPTDTSDYYAVAGYDAANFAVGGAGGKLLLTGAANTIPDLVAPSGTVSGPTTVTVGQPATYTANVVDNAGGSGIDPASFAFTATGTPGGTTNPVTLTFPSAGSYTVSVAFRDLAGNPATATLGVTAIAPVVKGPPSGGSKPPVKVDPVATKTAALAGGGSISLGVPRACVPVGTTFKATLAFKRSTKKGAKAVKVSRVVFSVDGKKPSTDKKAPFVKRISVKALKAGSKHTLKARATIKVKRGKSPKKSISTSFTVCS
jgi:hypothetical protein